MAKLRMNILLIHQDKPLYGGEVPGKVCTLLNSDNSRSVVDIPAPEVELVMALKQLKPGYKVKDWEITNIIKAIDEYKKPLL